MRIVLQSRIFQLSTSCQIIFVCDTNSRQCRNYTRNLVQIKIRHWIIQDQPHYWILSKWNSNLLFSLFLNHMIFSRFGIFEFWNFQILKLLIVGYYPMLHFELCDIVTWCYWDNCDRLQGYSNFWKVNQLENCLISHSC